MTDQNHSGGTKLLPYGLQILHGAPNRIVSHPRQKARKAASRLIVKNHAKPVRRKPAIKFLIKLSLAQPRASVKEDDWLWFHRRARRRIVLTVCNSRTRGKLPVMCIFKGTGFREL